MSVLYGFTGCRTNRAENLCKFLTDINYFFVIFCFLIILINSIFGKIL